MPRRMSARSMAGCCEFEAEGETWRIGSRASARLAAWGAPRVLDPRRLRRVVACLLASPEGRRHAQGLLGGFTRHAFDPRALELALTRALERGELVLLADTRVRPRVDALPGIAARPEPPILAPLDDFELSDKSLLISACPAEFAPRRGSITIRYLLRELAGQSVTLTLRSTKYPGERLLERPLDAAQTRDGPHDFVWDGRIELGPRAGELATPTLSPIRVELRHDASYNDTASFFLVPPSVEVLALGDFNFSTGREVLLPGPSIEAEDAGDRADGIALVAGLLAHLRRVGEPREVLIAGHTDAQGSDADNVVLSERRAENLRRYCVGDREAWAAHAHEHAELADAQEVLRWIAMRFGWPCDPGPIDGDEGPKTKSARSGFRARFEHERGESAGSGEHFDRADWAAFFVMYELDLAARLSLGVDELPSEREAIVLGDPATLGCGEHWPNDDLARPPVCRDDRRVELLVFHPDDRPDPIGGDDPPGKAIYEPGAYRWIEITPGPGPHPLEGPCFELEMALDDPASIPADAQLRLHGGPYDLRVKIGDAIHDEDCLRFHFHGIARGLRYSIDYEPPEGEPLNLARELDLDPLITTLDESSESSDTSEIGLTGFIRPLPTRETLEPTDSADMEIG